MESAMKNKIARQTADELTQRFLGDVVLYDRHGIPADDQGADTFRAGIGCAMFSQWVDAMSGVNHLPDSNIDEDAAKEMEAMLLNLGIRKDDRETGYHAANLHLVDYYNNETSINKAFVVDSLTYEAFDAEGGQFIGSVDDMAELKRIATEVLGEGTF
jgi:hypothetical protein